jgi:hypothetical protein
MFSFLPLSMMLTGFPMGYLPALMLIEKLML